MKHTKHAAHTTTSDEIREVAAMFALGALADDEAHEFAAHVEGCDVCAEELRSFQRAADGLDDAIAPLEPPASLRGRVLEQIAAQSMGPVTVRADEGEWQPIGPGVRERVLFVDAASGRKTALVRMEPGASVQSHRHVGVEEVFILEGDCHVERGHVLGPGDYYRAEAGTLHPWTYSERGTLFLSVYDNEFVTTA